MDHHIFVRRAKGFLFLQGPYGSFFRMLGDRLRDNGHRVERINFNGGDRHDWPSNARDFTASMDDWPLFIDTFIDQHDITDLVLYGDCRPMHRTAHGIAKLRGCRIHVFEEGYIRPDFMTLEREGVNGNSTLSQDPQWYLDQVQDLSPLSPSPMVAASFERRVREAISYNLATTMARLKFSHYRSHRPTGMVVEALGWLRRAATRRRDRRHSASVLAAIGDRPYFCFPLQLSSDAQIRTHSPFPDMPVAITYVIRSFAQHAPKDSLLVLKQHPLNVDLAGYAGIIRREAIRANVGDRVFYLEEADVVSLVTRARGVVTVNSTTGTLALREGVPTAVLGDAVYHIPRITHQGSLDAFWRHPVPPEAEVYNAFCRVLVDRCLVHGSYLSDEGLEMLVEGSVSRLVADATDTMPAASGRIWG